MHWDRSPISYIGGYFLAISTVTWRESDHSVLFLLHVTGDPSQNSSHKLVVMPHPRDSRSMLGIHHQMPNGMITGTGHILELHLSVSLVVRSGHNTIWERCVCFIRQLPAHYMTIDIWQLVCNTTCRPNWTSLSKFIPSDPLLQPLHPKAPHGTPHAFRVVTSKPVSGGTQTHPASPNGFFAAKILGVCIPGITQGTYNMDSCRMIKLITKKRSSPTSQMQSK